MIRQFFKKPPVVFPLVALFHIFITLHAIWLFFQHPYGGPGDISRLLEILSMLLACIFWFFVTDLRKWAAYAYIGLTVVNLVLHYFTDYFGDKGTVMTPFFPADLLFCFFILAYFKRFE